MVYKSDHDDPKAPQSIQGPKWKRGQEEVRVEPKEHWCNPIQPKQEPNPQPGDELVQQCRRFRGGQ